MFSDNIKDFLYFFNYSTKNITVRSYLEFSKDNVESIEVIGKRLNIEQPTAVTYLAKYTKYSTIINTFKLSKISNNQINPFYTVYKAPNLDV
jgi:hypothetical protein